jgi:hypothetical protein
MWRKPANEAQTVHVDLWFPIRRRTGSRNFIGSQTCMVIAHRPDGVAFPPLPRLAAHFTGAQRFQFADLDALQDRIRPVIYRFEV